jgi:hypothetical protein
LGVHGDDDPGPAVGSFGVAQLGCGPSEGLLEQAERVLDVESAQECLPAAVDVCLGGVGSGSPQPDWFRVAAAGQVVDLP